MFERLAKAFATRCDGRSRYEAHYGSFHHTDDGPALGFSVAPTKILASSNGNFSHARHQL
jgi:hypothetical protein